MYKLVLIYDPDIQDPFRNGCRFVPSAATFKTMEDAAYYAETVKGWFAVADAKRLRIPREMKIVEVPR